MVTQIVSQVKAFYSSVQSVLEPVLKPIATKVAELAKPYLQSAASFYAGSTGLQLFSAAAVGAVIGYAMISSCQNMREVKVLCQKNARSWSEYGRILLDSWKAVIEVVVAVALALFFVQSGGVVALSFFAGIAAASTGILSAYTIDTVIT